jgi:hypothetical protein
MRVPDSSREERTSMWVDSSTENTLADLYRVM